MFILILDSVEDFHTVEERRLHRIFGGLFSCIETVFAPAENFKAEPYTFNRNYLAHGMTRRPVRQRDCIQLFLALYNLTVFLKFA